MPRRPDPRFGPLLLEWSRRFRHAVVDLSQPGRLFEDLGVTYVGPVPGHDLVALDRTLRLALLEEEAPIIVHVRTRKGYGYHPAEADKVGYHGAALPPMNGTQALRVSTNGTDRSTAATPATLAAGSDDLSSIDVTAVPVQAGPSDGDAAPSADERASSSRKAPNYTAVMASELVRIASQDDRVVAITAGMPTGSGVATFGERFPERTFDVGIAEQHAMTLATGLALAGQRPFVGAVLDLPAAGLRPGRPRCLPERCARGHRHRSSRPGGRGRHQPPGHVHAVSAAPATQPHPGGTTR